jgi:predicted short-subunit dehydrogenase-like oxidoreductase (DUF2520 family)
MESKAHYSKEKLSITLAGAGNLAWNLCHAWKNLTHIDVSYWNRNPENSWQLSQIKKGNVFTHPSEITETPDFVFICTDDSAIIPTAALFQHLNTCLVHCSGSTALQVLQNNNTKVAVFYPLQTFSKNIPSNWNSIPVLIEADGIPEKDLISLAINMSATPSSMNSEQRLSLHLAAVFACNFTNHLWSVAYKICDHHQIPFNLLHPLIQKTVDKALSTHLDPAHLQTGPAKRKDAAIIQKHLDLLASDRLKQQIYKLISEDIATNK